MNIHERLARIVYITVKPDLSQLGHGARIALEHCVEAARATTDIFIRQMSHENIARYEALKKRQDKRGEELRAYFEIHGSPWDEFDHEKPFMEGVGKRPSRAAHYPADLTKTEWKKWLAVHPEDKEQFESNYTVIERRNGGLAAIPYAGAYRESMKKIVNGLLLATHFLPHGPLRKFLGLRAKALMENDYFESELAWLDTDGTPFEVTLGPYELYKDGFMGLKASMESYVGIPDRAAGAMLQKFLPLVDEFDCMLKERFGFAPKKTPLPVFVLDDVYRGGESAFGYLFVAMNLPNDPKVKDVKGAKTIISQTMLKAKFEYLVAPIVERIFSPRDMDLATIHNRLLFVLSHELCHGAGPNNSRVNGEEIPFEQVLGECYTQIEEPKADTLGEKLLGHFHERGALDGNAVIGAALTDIAANFSMFRQGLTEAHSRGGLMEYNWLVHHKAIRYNGRNKMFDIDHERIVDAMSKLGMEFLKLEVEGSYGQTKKFIKEWSKMPPELAGIITRLVDIPIAVMPKYELPF